MTTVYTHHKNAHAIAKAIGGLPYEIIDHGTDIQYMVWISRSVRMSIVRIPSERMEWKAIDYSDNFNYEVAIIVDGELRHETVQGGLDTDGIEKLLTEYCYGPIPPQENS